jgi:hypothetical protein
MGFLTEKEILELNPSELLPHPTPIPTQIVSSDEFTPPPQSDKQKGSRRGSSTWPTRSASIRA